MKHIVFLERLLSSLFLAFLLSLVPSSCRSDCSYPVSIDTKKPVQALLIYKAKLLQGNEALIVTDLPSIQTALNLLRENKTRLHACSYHWNFQFQHSLSDYSLHSHNSECEEYRYHHQEIHQLFQSYFARINETPSHFLYTLTINAAYTPRVVASFLVKKDRFLFPVRQSRSRNLQVILQKTVRIHIGEDAKNQSEAQAQGEVFAKKDLQKAIVALQDVYKVQAIESPRRTIGRLTNNAATQTFETILYCQYEQDVTNIDAILADVDVEIVDIVKPEEYMLLFAFPLKLTPEDLEELKGHHQFIKDIVPYGEY